MTFNNLSTLLIHLAGKVVHEGGRIAEKAHELGKEQFAGLEKKTKEEIAKRLRALADDFEE